MPLPQRTQGGSPERAADPRTPNAKRDEIIPLPGQSPKGGSIAEAPEVLVERITQKRIEVDTRVPKSSIFFQIPAEEIYLAQLSMYNPENADAGFPRFALHRLSPSRRRSDGYISLSPLNSIVSSIMQKDGQLEKEHKYLIELPKKGEEVIVTGSGLESSISIHQEGESYVVHANNLPISTLSNKPLSLNVHTTDVTTKKYATSDSAAGGQVKERKVHEDKLDSLCSMALVTANNRQYLLLEDFSDNLSVSLPSEAVARVIDEQKKLVNIETASNNAAIISCASPEHPYRNEDSAVLTKNNTGIIADGMGGYANGAYVSRLVTDIIRRIDESQPKSNNPEEVERLLVQEMKAAHGMLVENVEEGDSTVALARVVHAKNGNYVVWGNVGDSRVYVWHPNKKLGGGEFVQLSTDDNIVRRWERRAAKHDGWLFLGEKNKSGEPAMDPPLGMFRSSGFVVDEKKHAVLLNTELLSNLKHILDTFEDFQQFSDDSLLSWLFDSRNISDGIRNGPAEKEPYEYHSGIYKLSDGDEVYIMSDGQSDNVAESRMAYVLQTSPSNLFARTQSLTQVPQQMFIHHQEVLASLKEHEEDPLYFSRTKEDDVTVIALGQ